MMYGAGTWISTKESERMIRCTKKKSGSPHHSDQEKIPKEKKGTKDEVCDHATSPQAHHTDGEVSTSDGGQDQDSSQAFDSDTEER